eukprot:9175651-Pyramimonas_sp.AAC.1
MEERNCHHLAIREWAERNRQDREQLRAASAQIQQIISGAQVTERAAKEAQQRQQFLRPKSRQLRTGWNVRKSSLLKMRRS